MCSARESPNPANEQCIPNQQGDRYRVEGDSESDVLAHHAFNLLAEKWVGYRCPVIRFRKNIWYMVVNRVLPRIREEGGA
jgi:hypothetical protein